MEKHEEILLHLLENEGKGIAHHRMELLELINSGNRIDYSEILKLCGHLNAHIELFDMLDAELSKSENNRLHIPILDVAGF